MAKAILISIQPKWCEKIASGEKTIEVRKTMPKLETPFKVYIYCTKPSVKGRYSVGHMCFNTDELYRVMNGKIKYGDSIELMAIENDGYTRDNFLNGKVIGEFVCKGIMRPFDSLRLMAKQSCLTENELLEYSKGKTLYGWRIADLKIYDKPKELSEFFTPMGKRPSYMLERPPQSYMFVEELKEK